MNNETDVFHYPPDVFELLVDTIPRLFRGKKAVVLFLKGAGVPEEDIISVARIVEIDPHSINKFEIVRNVLTKLNSRGDSRLSARREIIKRVIEFESFETCWPADQLKAKGLVASIREAVDKKDSFTRMKQERNAERDERQSRQQVERIAVAKRREDINAISQRLAALFGMDDKPQERGKLLEGILNDLFRIYGILVHEDFRRRDPDTSVIVEQIDGVIELSGKIHLVEMKWLNTPVGIGEFSPHLVRLFGRADAQGIFIATNGYASSVISECRNALNQKTLFLCSLREFVMLLQRQDDLVELLRKKSQAAIV
ncbi:restriction endonuclease, partial [Acinetobacter baumannii]|nr:restriction endonuclease [Acinetobacter baumannii]